MSLLRRQRLWVAGSVLGLLLAVSTYRNSYYLYRNLLQQSGTKEYLSSPKSSSFKGTPVERHHEQVARIGFIRQEANDPHHFTRSEFQDSLQYYSPGISFSPRTVSLEESTTLTSDDVMSPTGRRRKVEAMTRHLNADKIPDARSYQWDFEKPFYEQCTPMEDWQTQFYPNCNIVHELDIQAQDNVLLSTKGSWRTVWSTSGNEGVLKLLQLEREFDEESFRNHQIDSIAMERLSKSRHVVDEYAFCGQSVVTEVGGSARDWIKNNTVGSYHRLLLAWDLALGMNDIHSLDTPKGRNTTLMHNDINVANILHDKQGRLKFNDFNIAGLMRWNQSKPCGYPPRFEGPLWRSPEEIRNVSYVSEKSDIFSMGGVLFQLLTKHQPWTWLEPNGRPTGEEVANQKVQGKLPFIPDKFTKSDKVEVQALLAGVRACFRPNPKKRPTAYQLARGFQQALDWVGEKKSARNLTKSMLETWFP